ncbi:uncharacterized protein B0P05DRAFT_531366 [Gilbertella persicaria]|uniref:uncharacterized protein n=1 Tax=Gilbertella persicaria TaxID=101096 RepID=UPI00221FAD32|nr:uncharacterized protein B0P05DRAFT_531366 [Gilbertella persicaria]KAI8088076.1 hypothetical protein B0P05DRAFT_531366 [Gilbertella persicaria]
MFRSTKFVWLTVARTANRNTSILQHSARINLLHLYRTFVSVATTTADTSDLGTGFSRKSVLGTTPQEKKELWERYVQRVESDDPTLTADDFLDICRVIHYDKNTNIKSRIIRTQQILTQIHTRLDQEGYDQVFVIGCNMLMRDYLILGDLSSAKIVFEGLTHSTSTPSVTSIMTIMHGIGKYGTKGELHQLVKSLEEKGLFPTDTNSVYIKLITEFRRLGDYGGCRYYFAEMSKRGLDTDETAYVIMFEVFKDAQEPEAAYKMFQYMTRKGIVATLRTYSAIIPLLAQSKLKHKADQLFQQAKNAGIPLSSNIYLSMDWDPMETLEEMKKNNMPVTIRDYNTCLAACVKQNKFGEALKIFNYMKQEEAPLDRFTYSIVIDALSKDLETPTEVVFDLYNEMKKNHIEMDVVLYTSLIFACTRLQHLERALSLLEDMDTYNIKPNNYTFNVILGILANKPDISKTDLHRTRLIWTKMTSMGISPDTRAFNLYLSIMSKLVEPVHHDNTQHASPAVLWGEDQDTTTEYVPRTVKEILKTYRYMRQHKEQNVRPDFVSYSIIINSLVAAGQIRSAMRVYDDAKLNRVTLPVSVYNEIMVGLQSAGKISEAMNIWHDMRLNSVLPDNQTYEIVLENCEQLGLMDSLKSIRDQRKLDFQRLTELERKREERMSAKKNKSAL